LWIIPYFVMFIYRIIESHKHKLNKSVVGNISPWVNPINLNSQFWRFFFQNQKNLKLSILSQKSEKLLCQGFGLDCKI
jgi:hypothetical protein